MKCALILFLHIPCVLFGQQSTTPLSSPHGSTGPIGRPPAKPTPSELSVQQPQVAPSNLPDRFEIGKLAGANEVNTQRLGKVEEKVTQIESTIATFRGAWWVISGGIVAALGLAGLIYKFLGKQIAIAFVEHHAKVKPPPATTEAGAAAP